MPANNKAFLQGYLQKTAQAAPGGDSGPQSLKDYAVNTFKGKTGLHDHGQMLQRYTQAPRRMLASNLRPFQVQGQHEGFHRDPSGIINRTYLGEERMGKGPVLFNPSALPDSKEGFWDYIRDNIEAKNPEEYRKHVQGYADYDRTRDQFRRKAETAMAKQTARRSPGLDVVTDPERLGSYGKWLGYEPSYSASEVRKMPVGRTEHPYGTTVVKDYGTLGKSMHFAPDREMLERYADYQSEPARQALRKKTQAWLDYVDKHYAGTYGSFHDRSPRAAHIEHLKKALPGVTVKTVRPEHQDPKSFSKWPHYNPFNRSITVPAPNDRNVGLGTYFHEATHAFDPSIRMNPGTASTYEFEVPAMAAARGFEMSPYIPENRRADPKMAADPGMARQIQQYGPQYTGDVPLDLDRLKNWTRALRGSPDARIPARNPFAYHGDRRTDQERAQAHGKKYRSFMNYHARQQ